VKWWPDEKERRLSRKISDLIKRGKLMLKGKGAPRRRVRGNNHKMMHDFPQTLPEMQEE